MACRIAKVFNEQGARKYGVIRIDSAEFGVAKFLEDSNNNIKRIAATFKEAAKIAADHGERLAAEGEVCWAGLHSWKASIALMEEVGMPEALGFQADLAHTYTFMLGYNAPDDALLGKDHTEEEFWTAYERLPMRFARGPLISTLHKTMAMCMGPATMIKRASTALPMIPTGNWISPSAPAIGCKVRRTAVSSTSAGMAACSPMTPLRNRKRGTTFSKP